MLCSKNELKGEPGNSGLKGEKGEPAGYYGSHYGGVQGPPGPPVSSGNIHTELLFVVPPLPFNTHDCEYDKMKCLNDVYLSERQSGSSSSSEGVK